MNITRQFRVAHFHGCFNQDTFEGLRAYGKVVLQWMGLRSCCVKSSIQTHPWKGKSSFNNHVAAQRWGQEAQFAVNALMEVRTAIIQEDIDLVAGDFNGASWRREWDLSSNMTVLFEEAFTDARRACPTWHPTAVEPWQSSA